MILVVDGWEKWRQPQKQAWAAAGKLQ